MSRELCHQQEALWELLTTELIYMRKLKIMTDVSLPQPRRRPCAQPHTYFPCIFPKTPRPEGGGKVAEGGRGGKPRDPPDLRPTQDLESEVSSAEVGG